MTKLLIYKTNQSRKTLHTTYLFLFVVFLVATTSCGKAMDSTTRDKVTAYFFYAHGCSSCESAELFVDDLSRNNPRVDIKKVEMFLDMNNFRLYQNFLEKTGLEPKGVPLILIADHQWAGFEPANHAEIIAVVESCLQQGCEDAYKDIYNSLSFSEIIKK